MTLESIGKLRKAAKYRTVADGLMSLSSEDSPERILRGLCDEIEREVAERFVELPVDADGEVIRIGDELELCEYRDSLHDVCELSYNGDNWYVVDQHGDKRNVLSCRHHNITVEGLLVELVKWFDESSYEPGDEKRIAKYAAKLREAVRAE